MTEYGEYKSRIDELKKRMYDRSGPEVTRFESKLHEKDEPDVPNHWKTKEAFSSKRSSFLNKVLIASVVFFIGALVFAYLSLQSGTNVISSDNIRITIEGPRNVSAGEAVDFSVAVENNNGVELRNVALLVDYPAGTRNPEDVRQENRRERVDLDTLVSGGEKEAEFSAIFFGEKGDKKVVTVGLEYRIPSSSSVFYTSEEYSTVINSSPLSLSIESPKRINSGQELTYNLTLTSNSTEPLKDLRVVAEYPRGFTYLNSSEKPEVDETVWNIDEIAPGEEETLSITGTLQGQQGDEKTVHFLVGIAEERNERLIATPFVNTQFTTEIEATFLELGMTLNGRSSQTIVTRPGSRVRGELAFENSLSNPIVDGIIEIEIEGGALDPNSVDAGSGIYSGNTIVWDRRSMPSLGEVGAGERGAVEFNFTTIGEFSAESPSITISAVMRGEVQGDRNVNEQINTSLVREVTLYSNLSLDGSVTHVGGPFPPVVGEESVYEVRWRVASPVNEVESAIVTAILPAGVEVTGTTSPSNADISFNSNSGEVVWQAGDLTVGAGVQVVFQIAFTPALNQVGSVPLIVRDIEARGQDAVADVVITDNLPNITTRLYNPLVRTEDAEVQAK